MDDPNRPRRQNEPPMHPSTNARYMQDPPQGRRSIPGSTDRYNRPTPLNTLPAQGRGMGASGSYSAYHYPESVAGSFASPMAATGAMQYQPGFGHGQDSRQQQSFGGYSALPMGYDNLAGTTGSVYEAQPHFQRQPAAAAPMLPTDVSASYFTNDPSNTPGSSNLPHAPATASSASGYQASSQVPSYTAGMSSVSGVPQAPPSAEMSLEEQDYPSSGALEEKWIEYQTALRGVFQNIRAKSLDSASQSLLDLSNWLLSQVTDLGLNLDDQKLHGDRIKLWEDFNHAWLGLLQAQKDMILSGQRPQPGQKLVSDEGLEKMGKDLIRLCDGIERHGLVDYQYGVWEQQIMDILVECQDLIQASRDGSSIGTRAGLT